MIRKEIIEACYHLYNPQNNPDQIDKRLGSWYNHPIFLYIILRVGFVNKYITMIPGK